MSRAVVFLLIMGALALHATAQKKPKPWTEWSEKEAQKILDNSPWGQTQIETDVSEMFYKPTSISDTRRREQGAINQSAPVNFYIRFLSAKPIRQAFARLIELRQRPPDPQLSQQLRSFVERKFDEWIVVAVAYDSKDQRFSADAMQAFNGANTGMLKNNTYLELKSGKRLFLQEYKAPINDGLGAKFIFPRVVDERPFISDQDGEVRFYSGFSEKLKLNMRFKIADFVCDGQLEY